MKEEPRARAQKGEREEKEVGEIELIKPLYIYPDAEGDTFTQRERDQRWVPGMALPLNSLTSKGDPHCGMGNVHQERRLGEGEGRREAHRAPSIKNQSSSLKGGGKVMGSGSSENKKDRGKKKGTHFHSHTLRQSRRGGERGGDGTGVVLAFSKEEEADVKFCGKFTLRRKGMKSTISEMGRGGGT